MDQILDELGLEHLLCKFMKQKVTPEDVAGLTDADFCKLGITTIGDRVRLKEKSRAATHSEQSIGSPVLDRIEHFQSKRKARSKVNLGLNNRKAQQTRRIHVGWKHSFKTNDFKLVDGRRGGGKLTLDLGKMCTMNDVKTEIENKYFPHGENRAMKLCLKDRNSFLANFTGEEISSKSADGEEIMFSEFLKSVKSTPIRLYIHTKTKLCTDEDDDELLLDQVYTLGNDNHDNVRTAVSPSTHSDTEQMARLVAEVPSDDALPEIDEEISKNSKTSAVVTESKQSTSQYHMEETQEGPGPSRHMIPISRPDESLARSSMLHVNSESAQGTYVRMPDHTSIDRTSEQLHVTPEPRGILISGSSVDAPYTDYESQMSCNFVTADDTDSDPDFIAAMKASMDPINIIDVSDSEDEQIARAVEASMLNSETETHTECGTPQSNMADILKNFQEKTVFEDTTSTVIVARSNVLKSAFAAMARPSFNPRARLYVKFSGEIGEDYGGPRREFFRLAIKELQASCLFEGPENCRYFSHNVEQLQKNNYFLAGQLLALSLLNEGPSSMCLSEHLFEYMAGNEMETFDCSAILPMDIQNIISQLRAVNNDSERDRFLVNHGDWLIDQGMVDIFRVNVSTKEEYALLLQKQFLCFRTSAEIAQFTKGMNTLNVWELVRENRGVFKTFAQKAVNLRKKFLKACASTSGLRKGQTTELLKSLLSMDGKYSSRI